MNKAALAEAGAGSPPFYFSERKIVPSEVEGHVLRQAQDRIFRKILKGLEVRGERWEEFLIFHIVPLIFKNDVDPRKIAFGDHGGGVRPRNRIPLELTVANGDLSLTGQGSLTGILVRAMEQKHC